MEYDTKKITNISDKVFEGRYSGVSFVLEPKESRYLPVEVSEHLAGQLAIILKVEKDEFLGPIIKTKEQPPKLTLKEKIDQHEKEFREWKEQERKEQLLKKDKALKDI